MPGFYPDKPATATDGVEFERGCVALLRAFLGHGDEVVPFSDQWSQFNRGENPAGIEYKELQKANDFVRIEIAEKTQLRRDWCPSGIMRTDNTVQYMCGSRVYGIYLFEKAWLLRWYRMTKPEEVEEDTIRSAVLSREMAQRNCLYHFFRNAQGAWQCFSNELAKVQDELRHGEGDHERRMYLWRRIDQLTALHQKVVTVAIERSRSNVRSANSECGA